MTESRLVRLGLVVMFVAGFVAVAGSAAGLSGIEPHRGADTAVVGDPDGYIGLTTDTDDLACVVTLTVTNVFEVDLTEITATVVAGPGTVTAAPATLAPGETGVVSVAVGTTDPTTVSIALDATGPDRRVDLSRSIDVDCVDADPIEPRTIGFWANHPEDWPLADLTVGGVVYTQDEALSLLVSGKGGSPVAGDVTRQLFSQTVATKLNLAAGADACIAPTVGLADDWLAVNPVGSGVSGSDPVWLDDGEPIKDALDAYNNGAGCE
jgi:hypothetical protein